MLIGRAACMVAMALALGACAGKAEVKVVPDIPAPAVEAIEIGQLEIYQRQKAENALGMWGEDILQLEADACHALLHEHEVEFEELDGVDGVAMPVRVLSSIGGVVFRHSGGSKKFSIMDCRLAVALAGWAPMLRELGVSEVVHMRAYSPGARIGGGGKVSTHSSGMAIDASRFIHEDGTELVVQQDWADRRYRAEPCEPSPDGDSDPQAALRSIACATWDEGLFMTLLTPHYNKAHYDHLHIDLSPDTGWYIQ